MPGRRGFLTSDNVHTRIVIHTRVAVHLGDKFTSKKCLGDAYFCEPLVFKSNQLMDNSSLPHYPNWRCLNSVFNYTCVVCVMIKTEVVPYVI